MAVNGRAVQDLLQALQDVRHVYRLLAPVGGIVLIGGHGEHCPVLCHNPFLADWQLGRPAVDDGAHALVDVRYPVGLEAPDVHALDAQERATAGQEFGATPLTPAATRASSLMTRPTSRG